MPPSLWCLARPGVLLRGLWPAAARSSRAGRAPRRARHHGNRGRGGRARCASIPSQVGRGPARVPPLQLQAPPALRPPRPTTGLRDARPRSEPPPGGKEKQRRRNSYIFLFSLLSVLSFFFRYSFFSLSAGVARSLARARPQHLARRAIIAPPQAARAPAAVSTNQSTGNSAKPTRAPAATPSPSEQGQCPEQADRASRPRGASPPAQAPAPLWRLVARIGARCRLSAIACHCWRSAGPGAPANAYGARKSPKRR